MLFQLRGPATRRLLAAASGPRPAPPHVSLNSTAFCTSGMRGSLSAPSYKASCPLTRPPRRGVATTTTSTAGGGVQQQQQDLRPLAYWLLGTGTLVAGMVTIGGITRLTRSGLSMTDWKIQGSLPPLSDEDWEREFSRYKQFPEYQQRQAMSLDEFKYIFWWEYGHRMTGRFLGLAYTLPLLYFSARGAIPRSLYPRLAALFALGGTQGLIGWWMVKSGLEMDPQQRKEIRVSPYRLATHLGMAFTTYTLLIWTGLDLLSPATTQEPQRRLAAAASASSSSSSQLLLRRVRGVRAAGLASAGLLGLTIISGAFVAGNDAGRAYNTFPKMGDDWLPEEMLHADLQPWYRNLFENTAVVQFDHRVLALSTATAIAAMLGLARGRPDVWRALPNNSKTAIKATASMVAVQVSLGISTLVLYVPTSLAVAHQAGSLVLLTLLTWTVHSLNRFVPSLRAAAAASAPSAATVAQQGVAPPVAAMRAAGGSSGLAASASSPMATTAARTFSTATTSRSLSTLSIHGDGGRRHYYHAGLLGSPLSSPAP